MVLTNFTAKDTCPTVDKKLRGYFRLLGGGEKN